MKMRSVLLAGAFLVATASASFAQSEEGGYLGLNPAANVPVSHGLGITKGSGQGGYLGENPGASLTAAGPAAPETSSGEGGYLGMVPGSSSTGEEIVSPNDPAYAANGAPRAGEPSVATGDSYAPILHQHRGG